MAIFTEKVKKLSNEELVEMFDKSVVALCYESYHRSKVTKATEKYYMLCRAELLERLEEH